MKYIHSIIALFLLLGISSCVKQEFDEPPLGGEPTTLEPNVTIEEVKAIHKDGEIETIDQNWIIAGEVVMDDRSGNYYKTIVIQDETAGLEVKFNDGFLYTDYPLGRRVVIELKGLKLTDYNGVVQLIGSTIDTGTEVEEIGLTLAQRATIVHKGAIATELKIGAVKTLGELRTSDISTLIRLENVEFTSNDAGETFAEPIAKITLNRYVQDCGGAEIIVRTSGYADFAGLETPTGNGSITGVLSAFNGDYQLYLRSINDAQMTDPRCDQGGGGTGNLELIEISTIRSLFTGSATSAPSDKKIVGTVISDGANGNITGRNLVIQDGTAGIVVRFDDNHSFALGDQIEVNVSNMEISDFNGLVQVNNVPNGRAFKSGTGSITPRTATVAQIQQNADVWESTLVKIVDATLSGAGTFSGSVDVTDATGTVPMFTRSFASFSGDALPSGTVEVTALVGDFNGVQLNMRNRNDVTGGMTGGGPIEQIDIADIRSLFSGSNTSAPANKKIIGTVISDFSSGNITSRNLVIQDGSAGIVVRFDGDHDFALGYQLEINVSSMEISEFNGLLQVNNVPLDRATALGTGSITPRVATIEQIYDNSEAWESTLVQVVNAQISGPNGTYGGSTTVNDGTETIPMFTRSQATFANSALPTGTVTLTALVGDFNGVQLNIRNTNDVQ